MRIYIGALFTFLVLQGCGEPSVDNIAKKIVKVETPNGKYTTVNKKSGAYGRYQIMPKTAAHYTKKLNISPYKWKSPRNQDRIFMALLSDNIRNLKKEGMDVNAFTVYGCHQQGATGFKCIVKNEGMTAHAYDKLRRNLPKEYRHIKNERLRKVWISYWKKKMS